MISYDILVSKLKQHDRPIIKKNYIVLKYDGPYHITIFEDQWNDNAIFHISDDSMTNRCSIYYKINKLGIIYELDDDKFKYNQPSFSSTSSTRSKCKQNGYIDHIIADFQIILNDIMI